MTSQPESNPDSEAAAEIRRKIEAGEGLSIQEQKWAMTLNMLDIGEKTGIENPIGFFIAGRPAKFTEDEG